MTNSKNQQEQGLSETNCPDSPSPEPFKVPDYPDAKYFESLQEGKKETLQGSKDEKNTEANEKMAQAKAAAENAQYAAKSVYEIALAKLGSAKTLMELRTKNKKKKIWREYIQCLRESLPKDHSDAKPVEEDDHVPPPKNAVCVAQLKQKLAEADLEYINDHLSSREEEVVAKNNWHVAENQYEAALCRAEKEEKLALCAAAVEWRQGISAALVENQGK